MRLIGAEKVDRVGVTVTFLRMEHPPAAPLPALPEGAVVEHRPDCSVAEFRDLYNGVGADHVWWLRRTVPDRELAAHLASPGVMIHILRHGGQVAGFHELDGTAWPIVNLAYFGLLPHAVGRGLGTPFLAHAIRLAWSWAPRALTVNTCTADHPRALPTYLRAGFQIVRQVDEVWEVPQSLGLKIPEALRRP